MVASVRWMRSQQFDLVIDLQCLARSGAFAWFANGRQLVGLDEVREGARGFYDIAVRRPSYHTHAVDWYLETLKALRVPVHWNFNWIPERKSVADALESRLKLGGSRWVAIQPGARWMNKRWPVEHFGRLVQQLATERLDIQIAILGGASDSELGASISRQSPDRCLDLTGKLSLPEMIELLRRVEVMVTNDTGPMHVAAALGKPVVGLFGPTEPRRTGPYGQLSNAIQGRLPCIPCMKPECTWREPIECLKMITPESVMGRVRRHLSASQAVRVFL